MIRDGIPARITLDSDRRYNYYANLGHIIVPREEVRARRPRVYNMRYFGRAHRTLHVTPHRLMMSICAKWPALTLMRALYSCWK